MYIVWPKSKIHSDYDWPAPYAFHTKELAEAQAVIWLKLLGEDWLAPVVWAQILTEAR